MSTPELITKLLNELRMDHQALADALGMGPRGVTLVRKWENGTVVPTTSALTAVKLLVRLHRLRAELTNRGLLNSDTLRKLVEPRVND